MGVVDVQIEHRPADFLRIEKVGQPGGIGNDALEMSAQYAAVKTAACISAKNQERGVVNCPKVRRQRLPMAI